MSRLPSPLPSPAPGDGIVTAGTDCRDWAGSQTRPLVPTAPSAPQRCVNRKEVVLGVPQQAGGRKWVLCEGTGPGGGGPVFSLLLPPSVSPYFRPRACHACPHVPVGDRRGQDTCHRSPWTGPPRACLRLCKHGASQLPNREWPAGRSFGGACFPLICSASERGTPFLYTPMDA